MVFIIRQNPVGAKLSQTALPKKVPQNSGKHWISQR